jgi:hypothetical protein
MSNEAGEPKPSFADDGFFQWPRSIRGMVHNEELQELISEAQQSHWQPRLAHLIAQLVDVTPDDRLALEKQCESS